MQVGMPAQSAGQQLRLHPTGVGDKHLQRDRSSNIGQRQMPFTSSFQAPESCNVAIVGIRNAMHKGRCHKVDAILSKWEFVFGVPRYCTISNCLWKAITVLVCCRRSGALDAARRQPWAAYAAIYIDVSMKSNREPLRRFILQSVIS